MPYVIILTLFVVGVVCGNQSGGAAWSKGPEDSVFDEQLGKGLYSCQSEKAECIRNSGEELCCKEGKALPRRKIHEEEICWSLQNVSWSREAEEAACSRKTEGLPHSRETDEATHSRERDAEAESKAQQDWTSTEPRDASRTRIESEAAPREETQEASWIKDQDPRNRNSGEPDSQWKKTEPGKEGEKRRVVNDKLGLGSPEAFVDFIVSIVPNLSDFIMAPQTLDALVLAKDVIMQRYQSWEVIKTDVKTGVLLFGALRRGVPNHFSLKVRRVTTSMALKACKQADRYLETDLGETCERLEEIDEKLRTEFESQQFRGDRNKNFTSTLDEYYLSLATIYFEAAVTLL